MKLKNNALRRKCYDLDSIDENKIRKSIILAPGEEIEIEDNEVSLLISEAIGNGELVVLLKGKIEDSEDKTKSKKFMNKSIKKEIK